MLVGIDIGGTKTLVVVFDEDGEVIAEDKHETNPDFHKFINETCDAVEKLVEKSHEIEVISVAAPGVMDYGNRRVHGFGNLEWHDVDIHTPLADHFECPVLVDNDGNLGALGEANLGAGKEFETMLYITISTGIGTGVTYKRRLDRALLRSEGGHMHFRHNGELMVWEKFASGKAFYEKYQQMGIDTPMGDPIWAEWAEDVSLGLGSLIAIIQPDGIVIGGSMGEHLEKYRDPLLNSLNLIRSPVVSLPTIVEASDPHRAVIKGCYVTAKDYVNNF